MSSQLSVEQLASRLNNFPYDRYLYIGSFMRSVAWAAGTIVLLTIFRNWKTHLPRLLPWGVTFLATMVTLMTWGRGVLFTNSRASVWDSVLPTAMGVVEFCLFAILVPQVFGVDSATFDLTTRVGRFLGRFEIWHFWFFFLAAHTALAVALVHNRIINTQIPQDYEPRLVPLANEYMQWMQHDRAGAWFATKASLISAVFMILFIHTFRATERWWIHLICGVLYLGLFVGPAINLVQVIADSESQRQDADRQVSEMVKISTTPAESRPPTPARKNTRRRSFGFRKD